MIHSSYIPIHPNPNSWSIWMNFPFCVCLVPIKTPADSPRNHNHSKTVAIGHGLSESRNGTAMDSSVLQLKQLLYMWQMLTDDFDILWYTLIMCHQSSVSSVSSSNIFTKYWRVARVQEKPEQIRAENNPLCLRNGSSMILQSFLLGSFEQYTVAERWFWGALQSTISLVNRMANMGIALCLRLCLLVMGQFSKEIIRQPLSVASSITIHPRGMNPPNTSCILPCNAAHSSCTAAITKPRPGQGARNHWNHEPLVSRCLSSSLSSLSSPPAVYWS